MSEMTAVTFLKEWKRMCDDCLDCDDCPMHEIRKNSVDDCMNTVRKNPEEAVVIVQHWTEEHPVKTRAMDFFEKFPNAKKRQSGIPLVCIAMLGYPDPADDKCGCIYADCVSCWNEPMEEEK